ncbi:hypothetical protein Golob_024965, partial [Gossypium lobatum]|nr:hypothetical protein [Gossypium lobatum]
MEPLSSPSAVQSPTPMMASNLATGAVDSRFFSTKKMIIEYFKKMMSLHVLSSKIALLLLGSCLHKTTSRLMFYRRALHSQRKWDLPMKEFLMKVKSYCDNLASCGEVISEHEHVTAIINGLPCEYESIVSIIVASQVPYSLQSVSKMLIDVEAQQQVSMAE